MIPYRVYCTIENLLFSQSYSILHDSMLKKIYFSENFLVANIPTVSVSVSQYQYQYQY